MTLEVTESEQRPLPLRQLLEAACQQLRPLLQVLHLVDRRLGERLQEVDAELQPVAPLPLAPCQHAIQRDPAGPGGEAGARLEPVELTPQDEVRLLHDLFGV